MGLKRKTSLSKKQLIIGLPIALVLFALGGYFASGYLFGKSYEPPTVHQSSSISEESIEISKLTLSKDLDVSSIAKAYGKKAQSEVSEQLNYLKKKNEYSLDNMLAVVNPYFSNTTGLYMYFNTKEALKVNYKIKAANTEDFSGTLNNGTASPYAKEHEYQLIGLVPGVENQVNLQLVDEHEAVIYEKNFRITPPDVRSLSYVKEVKTVDGVSKEKLTEGLYTILGSDIDKVEDKDGMFIYDNFGHLRAEIPIIGYRAHRVLFANDLMYMNISHHRMAAIDRLGKVKLFNTKDYTIHHDYAFGKNGNIVILATKDAEPTIEDFIIELNVQTGEIKELLDLGTLLGEYKKTTTLPKVNKYTDKLDWIHLNSISFVNDNDILVSARETSTIIKINDIFTEPKIGYMIGSDKFWKESGYDNLLLKQIGDFPLQSGQHTATYEGDPNLPEGQYYIHLYNNNNTVSASKPEFDWDASGQYKGSGIRFDRKADSSQCYKYLVDEKKGTFELAWKLDVAYSPYVSSTQMLDENLIINSGQAFTFYEFDKNRKLIRKFDGKAERFFYRVYKYDYKGFWFAK